MRIDDINRFKNGWLVGSFLPSLFPCGSVEIAIHDYKKDYIGEAHYHKIATEYNVIISGRVFVNTHIELCAGEIFIYRPGEISNVRFAEDTKLLIIKTPSVPGDKYLCTQQ